MVGICSKVDLKIGQNILRKIENSFQKFLSRQSRELKHPRILASFPKSHQVTLSTVSRAGCTYCLVRFPVISLKKLSRQQHKIALLVGEGHSNKVIAEKLGIHQSTVAAHIVVIFRKLGIKSRADLAQLSVLIS